MQLSTIKPTDRGIIVYKGPSLIDGEPIVMIATLKTNNRKTGSMIQTWILREDISPLDAIRSGDDVSICGDCPHRGINGKGRTCYVNVGQAPRSIHDAYTRGVYRNIADIDSGSLDELFANIPLRMGAYGDPAAVPEQAWRPLINRSSANTGYTHQWRDSRFAWLRNWVMASADNATDAEDAQSMGWRYFRVLDIAEEMSDGEIYCPSDKGIECKDCTFCDGRREDRPNTKSVAIRVHGGVPMMKSLKKHGTYRNMGRHADS